MQVHVYVFVGVLCVSLIDGQTDSERLRELQTEFWDWRMENNPTTSTAEGWYKYNDLMESFKLSDFITRRNKTLEFKTTLDSITKGNLDAGEQVNYDILKDTLETFLEGNVWAEYGALSPLSFIGGIQMYTGPRMASSNTRGDFENYIARLHAVQKQVDEIIELGRRAIQLNRTLHNVSIARVPEQIDTKIFDFPENSSYYSPFMERLDTSHVTNQTDRDSIRTRGRTAVTAYMDAFRQLKTFIVNEYMPATRKEFGVYAWDPTHEYYKACLKWHLSFAMSPDEVYDLGVQEVDRISAEMNKIMTSLKFEGSIADFFQSLEGDSRFYLNSSEPILQYYKDVLFDRINPKLDTLFKNIPDVPIEIRASQFDGIGGGYSSATENSPGIFTINLFRPSEVPLFEAMALTLHEANPGHHMQHSYSMQASLPDFRRDPVLSFYNIPNWFPYYSAYMEGWALYTEYLGEEMGLYKDEYEMMGRYSYEILRASRLVIDVGLHYKGWSWDEAVWYLQNHTALVGGSATNEIDRYITWPGQACAYKVGELKIKELRRVAEADLGSLFDIKDFHLLILENGAMPMSVLEQLVTDWVAEIKTRPASSEAGKIEMMSVMLLLAVVSTVIAYF